MLLANQYAMLENITVRARDLQRIREGRPRRCSQIELVSAGSLELRRFVNTSSIKNMQREESAIEDLAALTVEVIREEKIWAVDDGGTEVELTKKEIGLGLVGPQECHIEEPKIAFGTTTNE